VPAQHRARLSLETLSVEPKTGRAFHLRSDRWPKWACRRAPINWKGALLERWRAQFSKTLTTIIHPIRRTRVCTTEQLAFRTTLSDG